MIICARGPQIGEPGDGGDREPDADDDEGLPADLPEEEPEAGPRQKAERDAERGQAQACCRSSHIRISVRYSWSVH